MSQSVSFAYSTLGGFMGFFSLPPRVLTIIGVLLGLTMVEDLNAAEQNSLGNFLILIGQVLETNAAQLAIVDAQNNVNKHQELEARIAVLEQLLKSKN